MQTDPFGLYAVDARVGYAAQTLRWRAPRLQKAPSACNVSSSLTELAHNATFTKAWFGFVALAACLLACLRFCAALPECLRTANQADQPEWADDALPLIAHPLERQRPESRYCSGCLAAVLGNEGPRLRSSLPRCRLGASVRLPLEALRPGQPLRSRAPGLVPDVRSAPDPINSAAACLSAHAFVCE